MPHTHAEAKLWEAEPTLFAEVDTHTETDIARVEMEVCEPAVDGEVGKDRATKAKVGRHLQHLLHDGGGGDTAQESVST
eukprot:CAMPEP_0175902650 /NCGR_PEP_ID=MMETSP0108-20121206/3503_1 /TAXON_ID=195067 ORGANISM="Goniomonas pacifica, Strain CCMP1869" /NCGR_SAMPLE_ID=MMETSP0108 /ASSEMBLY_ACC=CAM_ASM_000204 /LENGTH=78 /DNA_ID=CAMNT_0017224303 /DNA_START=398 /DNA_END=634 /DNA_ORIENTATION=+